MPNRNTTQIAEIDAQLAGDTARRNSVVKSEYKHKYANAVKEGKRRITVKSDTIAPKALKKAMARSTADWLAQNIAVLTLDEKAKLVVPKLEAILDANGVKHAHWNRTTPGWQGRLRMTGRLALQRVVAETGVLKTEDGEIAAPKAWVARFQN